MLSDSFLAGFRAGLRGRPSGRRAGAYDAMPSDLEAGAAEKLEAQCMKVEAVLIAAGVDQRTRLTVKDLLDRIIEHCVEANAGAAEGATDQELEDILTGRSEPDDARAAAGRDQEGYDALVAFLRSKLSNEDAARVIAILEGRAEDDGTPFRDPLHAGGPAPPIRSDDDVPHRLARPMQGGGLSMDGASVRHYAVGAWTHRPRGSAGDALAIALRASDRIKHDDIFRPPPRRVSVHAPIASDAAGDNYDAMFPSARRLG